MGLIMTNVSKYDERKVRIKITLLEITLKQLGQVKFEDINIKDICEEADISKVTYFKYFPNKGDILLYFMTIWSYQLEVEIKEKALTGVRAIEYAFQRVLRIDNCMNLMMGLIGFISKMTVKPNKHNLSRLEKQTLFPKMNSNNYAMEGKKIDAFFRYHLIEAKKANELPNDSSIDDTVIKLLTVFYGTPFTLFTLNSNDIKNGYKINLDTIFK